MGPVRCTGGCLSALLASTPPDVSRIPTSNPKHQTPPKCRLEDKLAFSCPSQHTKRNTENFSKRQRELTISDTGTENLLKTMSFAFIFLINTSQQSSFAFGKVPPDYIRAASLFLVAKIFEHPSYNLNSEWNLRQVRNDYI